MEKTEGTSKSSSANLSTFPDSSGKKERKLLNSLLNYTNPTSRTPGSYPVLSHNIPSQNRGLSSCSTHNAPLATSPKEKGEQDNRRRRNAPMDDTKHVGRSKHLFARPASVLEHKKKHIQNESRLALHSLVIAFFQVIIIWGEGRGAISCRPPSFQSHISLSPAPCPSDETKFKKIKGKGKK